MIELLSNSYHISFFLYPKRCLHNMKYQNTSCGIHIGCPQLNIIQVLATVTTPKFKAT